MSEDLKPSDAMLVKSNKKLVKSASPTRVRIGGVTHSVNEVHAPCSALNRHLDRAYWNGPQHQKTPSRSEDTRLMTIKKVINAVDRTTANTASKFSLLAA